MKVLKATDTKRPAPENPKPESGKALREGMRHLAEHHREESREMNRKHEKGDR